MAHILQYSVQRLTNITDGTSGLNVAAGDFINKIAIRNTTANAITGGIKIGTTTGAADVVLAIAVAGNALITIQDAALLKTMFSTVTSQALFVQTATLWNSASIDVTMYCLAF